MEKEFISNRFTYGIFSYDKVLAAWLVLVSIIPAVFYYLIENIYSKSLFKIWFAIIMLGFIIDLIAIHLSGRRLLSLLSLFTIFSYIFHFGIVIIKAFYPEYTAYQAADPFALHPYYNGKILFFTFMCIQIVVASGLLATKKFSNNSFLNRYNDPIVWRYVAVIICVISVPLRIWYIRKATQALGATDYASSLNIQVSGVIIQFSLFYIIGLVLLIVLNKERPRIARGVVFLGLIVLLFEMTSGSRIYCIIGMITLMYTYYSSVGKLDLFKVIIYALIGFVGVELLLAVSYLRAYGTFDLQSIISVISSGSYSIFTRFFDEFGWTIYSVVESVYQVPEKHGYGLGNTYLYAFSQALINIGGILNEATEKSIYMKQLDIVLAAGGSYVGELYYNFGYLGVVFAIFVGSFVGKISEIAEAAFKKNSYILIAFIIMPFYFCIIWVRGYFMNLVRGPIWAILFIIFLYIVCRQFAYRRTK